MASTSSGRGGDVAVTAGRVTAITRETSAKSSDSFRSDRYGAPKAENAGGGLVLQRRPGYRRGQAGARAMAPELRSSGLPSLSRGATRPNGRAGAELVERSTLEMTVDSARRAEPEFLR